MKSRTRLLLASSVGLALVSLLWLGCSGGSSDPTQTTQAGYDALGKSDWMRAKSDFDAALSALKTTDAGYLRAKMGQVEALIHVDATQAKDEFLALAQGLSSQVGPKDFIAVASKLTSERKFMEAVAVLDTGLKIHSEDVKLRAVGDEIKKAATKAGDDQALAALKGLGYL